LAALLTPELLASVATAVVVTGGVVWAAGLRKQQNLIQQNIRLTTELEQLQSSQQKAIDTVSELEAQYEQLRQRSQQQQLESARLSERCNYLMQLEDEHEVLQQSLQQQQRLLADRNQQFAELESRWEAEREAYEEKLQLLKEAREQLKLEFSDLATRIFNDKSQRFTEQNREHLGHLLNPLREQLGDFKRRVEDVYVAETKERRALQQQIEQLKQLNQQMSQDAVNLTNALKGENKAQGNWGEVVLQRVLEQSGLREGHEFETQVSVTEAGRRYQPDVIVRLPDGKDVIVDSKASLLAYERYCSAEDPAERERHLKDHLTSVRGHIKSLSEKAYQQLEGVRSLDFVLQFIPVEGAFLLALEKDPELFSFAFERNIILVSPATLLVTLRTIHNLWRNEYQNRNAREIARRGGELHDKFVGFVESVEEVGKHLERGQQAYELAHKRLVSGRGNLVSQAVELQRLGAKNKKQIQSHLTDEAAESDPALTDQH